MNPETIAVVVGLLIGWLADFLVRDRGYGMTADLGLGLGGGLVGVVIVQAVGIGPEAGWFGMTLVSLVGAAGFIGAQRRFWPGTRTVRTTHL